MERTGKMLKITKDKFQKQTNKQKATSLKTGTDKEKAKEAKEQEKNCRAKKHPAAGFGTRRSSRGLATQRNRLKER